MSIWIPLNGGEGDNRKKPRAGNDGWQLFNYEGADESCADSTWLGLRLDDYIVVDCDSEAAMEAWRARLGYKVGDEWDTLTRKTPKGWHFFYRRTVGNLTVSAGKPFPQVDLKLGMGHYVVWYGEGYSTVGNREPVDFDPAWLPADYERNGGIDVEEWSEMPEGMGDNAMIGFAGAFRRYGMDEQTILRCLTEINAITMTEKPMPPGRLKRLARSSTRWDPDAQREVLCPKCATTIVIV